MKHSIRNLGLAIALAASATGAFAQQQQYGRDSVYADPRQTTRQASSAANGAAEPRFGRDSVYASASSRPSSPVTADAAGLNRYGRDSVYAIQLGNPQARLSDTRIGRAPSESAAN